MRRMRISDVGLMMNSRFAAHLFCSEFVYIQPRKFGCSKGELSEEGGVRYSIMKRGASVINGRCGLLFSGNIICCYYLDGLCNWSRQSRHLSTDWVFSSMFSVQTCAGTHTDKDLNVSLHELQFISPVLMLAAVR